MGSAVAVSFSSGGAAGCLQAGQPELCPSLPQDDAGTKTEPVDVPDKAATGQRVMLRVEVSAGNVRDATATRFGTTAAAA